MQVKDISNNNRQVTSKQEVLDIIKLFNIPPMYPGALWISDCKTSTYVCRQINFNSYDQVRIFTI